MNQVRLYRGRFVARCLWSQKLGNRPDEYEDAYDLSNPTCSTARVARYAIADGATTSAFAREWANLLVHDFVNNCKLPLRSFSSRVGALELQWKKILSGMSLPWYAEEQVRRGAFSTILGFVLHSQKRAIGSKNGIWEAVAIGDSCLFQIRNRQLIRAFPLSKSSDFTSRPVLLSSRSHMNFGIENNERRDAGEWEIGDKFFLMTDAMAAWFLSLYEEGARPWENLDVCLSNGQNHTAFITLVDELRETRALRNDDLTLISIDVINDTANPT